MPRRSSESPAKSVTHDREVAAAAIRAGDAQTLESMFRAHGDTLRRFAYRFVRSRDAAAEVVQDVFCNVWRAREQFALQDEPVAYLFSATRNRALDVLARESVRRRWYDEWCVEQLHPATRQHAKSTDEDAHLGELHLAIEDALGRMPARRQLVCRLRWKDGLTPREIADQLQIALKTVETQISRGLRDLRRRLNGHLEA
ncbi:MAG TPA: sigma-70 family RNA polymerase sigma factor [Gemmatimonadaceae bacterium]|nr:sigma-70 family RNA polymerase sigma factor [Gemmatimonadaceae bacterium]